MLRAAEFVDALRRFRLLEPAQLDELTRQLPGQAAEPRALARQLIERGWLTPFQVNLLFQGRGPELVLGAYVLLERLGEGGMGAVFKARHQTLGRVVALKVIRKDRLQSDDAVRRFRREIQAAAQLHHPNIVLAFDADQAGDAHFLVMEYVEGTDLARRVKSHGPLAVADACECVRQAALGLQHAHERGLVHRDIKPHNLLIAAVGTHVKILDMGLARFAAAADGGESTSHLTQLGMVMGTPDFMAPEQGQESHTVDIRADLYSLGCTLYFLLTGSVPFPGGSAIDKLVRHRTEEPMPVERRRPDVPPHVVAVVRKLMAKRPEDRYQTPAELVAVLGQVNEPVASPAAATVVANPMDLWARVVDSDTVAQSPPKRPAMRYSFDYRWLLAGAASVLAVGLLLLVIRLFSGGDREPGKPETPTAGKPAPDNGRDDPRKEDPARAERRRVNEAEEALRPLVGMAKDAAVEPAKLRDELRQFLMRHSGTPAATRACALLGQVLAKLPSPLDRLDPVKIPEDAKTAWKTAGFDGKDVVAVLGESARRHWGTAWCPAFSPDGNLVASVGEDGALQVWDRAADRMKVCVAAHQGRACAVTFTPDGSSLVSAGLDGKVVIWDAKAARGRFALQHVAGKEVGDDYLWAVVSPDGQLLASCNETDPVIKFWDLNSGRELFASPPQMDRGKVWHVKFAPDGKTLAVGHQTGIVSLWEVPSGRERQALKVIKGYAFRLAFASGGKALAVGEADIHILDPDLRTQSTLPREGSRVRYLQFLDENQTLLAVYENGKVKRWRLENGKELASFQGPTSEVTNAALSPDLKTLATSSRDGTVRLWDAATGQEVRPPAANSLCMAFSPDGAMLATGQPTGNVQLWSLTGPVPTVQKQFPAHQKNALSAVEFSPSGKLLATGATDTSVKLWDLVTGEMRQKLAGRSVAIPCIAFSPDEKLVAFTSQYERGVKIYEVATGELRKTLPDHSHDVTVIAFNPNGLELAAGVADEYAGSIWNLTAGLQRFALNTEGTAGGTYSLAYSPDGQLLAAALRGHQVKVWQAATGRELVRQSVGSPGRDAAFSPDGKLLATSHADGRVILWEPASGRQMREWQLSGPVPQVAFAHDGRHLATANANGTVYLFRLAPPPDP